MLDWWQSSERFKRYIYFSEIFTYFSPPVTLKMRSRSLKSNQLLSLSYWYIYVSLETIHPLIQEISYIQDYDLKNRVKVTKIFTCLNSVTIIYPLKSDEYPQSVGHLTRKSGGPGFDTRSGNILSFLLPLFQEGQLSVTGESMCTKYWLTA